MQPSTTERCASGDGRQRRASELFSQRLDVGQADGRGRYRELLVNEFPNLRSTLVQAEIFLACLSALASSSPVRPSLVAARSMTARCCWWVWLALLALASDRWLR